MTTVLDQIHRQAQEAALQAVQVRLQLAAVQLIAVGAQVVPVDLEEIRRLGIELRAISTAMDVLHSPDSLPVRSNL